jgi:hypothetical protein
MRRLIVSNRFSLCSLIGSLKVYIDNPNGELEIHSSRCHKLGQLKNGESQAFEIDEDEHLIYLFFSEVSRDSQALIIPIHKGKDEVRISGRRKFNPTSYNPFSLDK